MLIKKKWEEKREKEKKRYLSMKEKRRSWGEKTREKNERDVGVFYIIIIIIIRG